MSKYNSRTAVTMDGIKHASEREALRWTHLNLLQRAGVISDLQRQVSFELIPAQWESYERYGKKGKRLKDGKRCVERSVVYVADFVYMHDGKQVVEDAKGVRTADYVIKRKLMLYLKGIKILET